MFKLDAKSSVLALLMVLLCANRLSGQIVDNFDDGNYTQNPQWTDDSVAFSVNTNGQLQLNAPARDGKSYIYLPSYYAANACWEFKVKMDFNPSSSSYCRVFLMADQQNPASVSAGYFLKIGGTNDDVCLYSKNGSTETLIINGRDKMLNTTTVNASIKVTRDNDGNWELFCDSIGNETYTQLGTAIDNSILQSSFFIVECVYIASRSTKIYFDDIKITGEAYSDGTIPTLISFKPISKQKIECQFSEPIADISSGKFLINNINPPENIEVIQEKVILTYSLAFACETSNSLSISGIKDKWNNCIRDTSVSFNYCTAQRFDVVFNEIMADPSPALKLPDVEYIELYNRSNKALSTKNWTLKIGSGTYLMPDTQIQPKAYVLLCAQASVTLMKNFGTVISLFTSSAVLNNSGQSIYLYDSEGSLISWVEYADTWYNDDYKAEGGWSLEQIDPSNPCGSIGNWIASKSKTGGTPGAQNSVYAENPDLQIPEIHSLYVPNDTTILLIFNEPLLSTIPLQKESFNITPDLGMPKSAGLKENEFHTIQLTLNNAMVPGKIYHLLMEPTIADCAGNKQQTVIDTLVGLPRPTDSLDLVINEVLFNPLAYNPEYIELYNRSNKILDGSNLVLTFESKTTKSTFLASGDVFLCYPHSYHVFCPTPELLPAIYPHCNINTAHKCTNWKSLDDKAGTITLQTKDLQVIDKICYAETMQQQSLTSKEGVALERINPDVPGISSVNWHSAAETVQYGTPGMLNSQDIQECTTTETFTIEKEIFSPDNDGYDDVLKIGYHFDKPGYRISAWIFDALGRNVTCLLNNLSPANTDIFWWDGNSEQGKLCPPGIYMVFIRMVDDKGEVKEFKKACILALKR